MSKTERSKRMSLIRSKWTKPEKMIHNALKGRKVKHKMHPHIPGSPDILVGKREVIFIHGCFWHKCPRCYNAPTTRKEYWAEKVLRNVKRDKKSVAILSRLGYHVLKIWEHEVREDFDGAIRKILK